MVIKDVSYIRNNQTILSNINLKLTEKKIGIIGSNGSGKSTFLKLLNGLIQPTNGNVTVDGIDTKEEKQIRKNVGFVFQNPDNQIIFPVVKEDLEFSLKNLEVNNNKIEEKIDNILKSYHLLHLKDKKTHYLSGGEKQMIAILGVLITKPRYIIFDEPITGLDLKNELKIMDLLNSLKVNIIVSSHNFSILSKFNRVIVLDKGKVIFSGIPKEAINFYKEYIFKNSYEMQF